MTNSKYALQEPNGVTKKRMLEVKLYLFTETFLNKLGKHSRFKPELIGIICNAYNLNTSAILSAITAIESPQMKPSQREIAISSHYMGIPVRTLTEQGIVSTGNYYKILQEYINDDEPTLHSKLTDLHHENIELLFENVESMFFYISNIIKGDLNI